MNVMDVMNAEQTNSTATNITTLRDAGKAQRRL